MTIICSIPGWGGIQKDHAGGEFLPKEERLADLIHCFMVTGSRNEA